MTHYTHYALEIVDADGLDLDYLAALANTFLRDADSFDIEDAQDAIHEGTFYVHDASRIAGSAQAAAESVRAKMNELGKLVPFTVTEGLTDEWMGVSVNFVPEHGFHRLDADDDGNEYLTAQAVSDAIAGTETREQLVARLNSLLGPWWSR